MKKLFIFIFISGLAFASCKKTDCPVQTPPPDLSATIWTGPSAVNTIAYTMNFTLAADGTMTGSFTGGGTFPFTGTWSKSPNSSLVYIFFTQAGNTWKGQGTLNAASNKIEGGTLTQLTGGAFTGTFNVSK
jgi:hypothetical protein